jgi:hypothetical protein
MRRTFQEWNEEYIENYPNAGYNFYVLDPDGFDRESPDFYTRRYSREEFESRAMSSTCMIAPLKEI